MPLADGYGVLAGTLQGYSCDVGHSDEHYYHCTVMVRTPRGPYPCAIDLDSKANKYGIEWRIVELGKPGCPALSPLRDGWHPLSRSQAGGAIDYYRSPEFQGDGSWKHGTGREAFADIEALLRHCRRLFVFGEPFRNGVHGVHNIHQNQGDPVSSRWAMENGPWQDGALFVERSDGSMVAFLCRFSTQRKFVEAVKPEPASRSTR
ncbi:MAG: YukJ family protein [Chlorobiaceae bacterium]|nr:YukJ family protein [Chlorobiaceae bacterium]